MNSELSPLLPPLGGGRKAQHRSNRLRYLGFGAIFALLWISVTQSEAAQALQASSNFNKPFFISCLDHTITVLLLPVTYIYHYVGDRRAGNCAEKCGFLEVLQRHSAHPLHKLLKMAVVLNTVYIVADYLWFTALAMVSVAVSTAISNTAPVFVYLFSICLLHERASWVQVSAVVMSFVGVALFAFFQDGPAENAQASSLLACCLVVIQTIILSAYAVTYRVLVGKKIVNASTVIILTGLCGLVTIPIWFVGSLLLVVSPISAVYEPLGLPETGMGLFLLAVSGSLAGIYTLLLSLAICWTSPLLTSAGNMLTIPLSLLWDVTINHRVFSWECFLGAALVMAGFLVLAYNSPKQPSKIKSASEKRYYTGLRTC